MANKQVAKTLLRSEDTVATACYFALDALLEKQWLAWEPESIWLELNNQRVDVPLVNREKIMAARSLITTGRFWFDALAFEKTAVSFSNELCSHVGIEDAPVAFIHWAVFEAELLHKQIEELTLEFDREPVKYTAVQLYREGFVVAPEMLSWAQPALNAMYPKETNALAKKVHQAWADAPHDSDELVDAAYPETKTGVQMARLASVQVHFNSMIRARRKQLAQLKGPLDR